MKHTSALLMLFVFFAPHACEGTCQSRSDGASDAAEEGCPAGRSRCGSLCVDLQSNHDHCGECFNTCKPAEVCNGGECILECPAGSTPCSGECVDTSSDPYNCGECGIVCNAGNHARPACEDGTCTVICDDGWFDLDDDGSCDDECDPATEETCNGVDDNCNGEIDEGFECTIGDTKDCNDCGRSQCSDECTWGPCRGDGACDYSQTCNSQGYCVDECGNGLCSLNEYCSTCPADCGECGQVRCPNTCGGCFEDTNVAFECGLDLDNNPESPGNMCHYGPCTPGLEMTWPGGYCDPDGDLQYDDEDNPGDYDRGYAEYCARCPC